MEVPEMGHLKPPMCFFLLCMHDFMHVCMYGWMDGCVKICMYGFMHLRMWDVRTQYARTKARKQAGKQARKYVWVRACVCVRACKHVCMPPKGDRFGHSHIVAT